MRAMSYRSDFFTCGSRVNSEQPAISVAASLLSALIQVELLSFLISMAMSDSISLDTSLLEVMISSKNEHVFLGDLSNLP